MRWIKTVAAAAIAGLLYACTTPPAIAPTPPAPAGEVRTPVTILISIDGFRADYLDRGITPALSRLATAGARGAMRPAFPTKTFPNHYAIVTGLVPDRNGIVANRFEDPARPGETFTMAVTDPYWWEQGEPIWVAAEKAGIRTATMFWPGSNVKIQGAYPSDWQQFSQQVSGRQRVDAVIDWMRRPAATRPRFATLYFDVVDTAGHRFGPDAAETNAVLRDVDALIGRLTDELAALGQPANLVIVADHGMAAASTERLIRLDQIANPQDYRVIEEGPFATIEPQPGRGAALAAALRKPHPRMQCWRQAEIPARLRYGRNPRVASFLCLAETGWMIATKPPAEPWHGGNHGWDNAAPEMQALFIASGPAFAAGVRLPPFDNVDVYPLLRTLIGLPAAPGIDGDDSALRPALRAR
ncbi:ectonucleotide pyrophosphatase/phosphodiesterase [Sphingomonas sp. BT-65]|uniref:alkaline phosphatase family protein n=1 Tax=Sphingomonas sp. BT-65 TaxID=2989821 RepID=UPI0022354395|nr:ectonucleotide pyrophosphatase/phosphodiesterase [Sphingomonas sp. BT-65]MCW4461786.1 ectonucleotide pyrophosphatase/phosphodiesterase [Sphingomonas sp. BT-65]